MKILSKIETVYLDILLTMEIGNIERGFEISETLGKLFLNNAIDSFVKNFLNRIYGDIIPSFSSEYRYFICGLLKGFKDNYKEIVFVEVLIPKVQRLNDTELLEQLKELFNSKN